MPGLVEGMQGYSATVANLANKDRVRLQSKIDAYQFGRQQVADEKRDELVAAIGDLDERERQLDVGLKRDAVDTAITDLAEGNWDTFEDFFRIPENRVMLQEAPQLQDKFGGKVNTLRRINPNDPNDTVALDRFAQSLTKGESTTYNELFPGLKKYFDEHPPIIADVEGVGPVATRSDDLLETFGTVKRRTKANRIFSASNTAVDNLQKQRVSALKQQLQVLDPTYTGASDDALAQLKLRGQELSNTKTMLEIRKQLMGGSLKDRLEQRKAGLTILSNAAEYGFSLEGLTAENVALGGMFSEEEVALIHQTAQDEKGDVARRLKVSEDNLELALQREERIAGEDNRPSAQKNIELADKEAATFQTETLPKYTVTVGGVEQPASYDNYALWPQELKREARSFAANYGQLKGIGATSNAIVQDIASLNQISEHAINYAKTADEDSRGLWDDFRNFAKSYVDEQDPTRKAAKEAELVGLLMAAASSDRTSVYFTEQMKAIAGTEFGKSYFNQLGSIETLLRGFAAKLQPYSDFNLNPVDAAIVDSYKKQIDSTVALIQPIIGVGSPAAPVQDADPKAAAEEV